MNLDVHRTGIAIATFVGCIHLLWSLIVAAGLGQHTANFVFRLHFIKPLYQIDPFRFDTAAMLVALIVASGYASGALFALLWNRLHR